MEQADEGPVACLLADGHLADGHMDSMSMSMNFQGIEWH